MNLTKHAKDKLDLYGIPASKIIDSIESASHDFYDTREHSKIKIVNIDNILLALVLDEATDELITVYRTDRKTISRRRRTKRWI